MILDEGRFFSIVWTFNISMPGLQRFVFRAEGQAVNGRGPGCQFFFVAWTFNILMPGFQLFVFRAEGQWTFNISIPGF